MVKIRGDSSSFTLPLKRSSYSPRLSGTLAKGVVDVLVDVLVVVDVEVLVEVLVDV